MNIVKLHGKVMTNKTAAHRHLMLQFSFPAYYGCNLDALHDLLGEINTKTIIVFYSFDNAKKNLGEYADYLLEVLSDSVNENSALELIVY